MEHIIKNNGDLPMPTIINQKERVIAFITNDLVMEGDRLSGSGINATVKEIIDERPAKGRWLEIGYTERPNFYKVKI